MNKEAMSRNSGNRGERSMREILFRGKEDYPGSEFIEGNLFISQDTGYYFIVDKFLAHGFSMVMVNPETVGQYIGLRDQCGQKIFEGDIVELVSNKECGKQRKTKCVIEYSDGAVLLKDLANGMYTKLSACRKVIKVIGNIHE